MSQERSAAVLTGETLVCDLFAAYPSARSVFEKYGYRGCGGPTGPAKPIAVFAKNHEVPLEQLLAELRQSHRRSTPL